MSYISDQNNIERYFKVLVSSKILIPNPPTGVYSIFTWNDPKNKFIASKLSYALVAKAGVSYTAPPTTSMGTNATSYNNWISSGTTQNFNFDNTTSTVNTVGQHFTLPLLNRTSTGIPLLTNGTTLSLNIASNGSGGSAFTLVFTLEGFLEAV